MIEKYQQIVKMLLTLTNEDRVEWEKTSSSEYKVSIGSSSISILYHEGSPNNIYANSNPNVTFLKLIFMEPEWGTY